MKKRVEFKSNFDFYEKERKGIKPNTVRVCDVSEDSRFDLLRKFAMRQIPKLYIKIICAESPSKFFIREIKDVSIYGRLWIISWEAEREWR